MKRGFILIFLLLCSYITAGAVIAELEFKSQGYKDLYINDSDFFSCTSFDFLSPDMNGETFAVLSLRAGFGSQPKEASLLKVYFNNALLDELNFRDFPNWVSRIEVPAETISGSNEVKVCGKAAVASGTIKVGADSAFGIYSGAHFPEKDGFTLDLETYAPYVGIPFTARAVARNYGTQDAPVLLTYRKQELEENTPEISVLKGETSKQGIVPKCRERNEGNVCTKPGEYAIEYEIVANKAVPFTVLPAMMTFTNIFGEQEQRLTQRPNLGALEPPHKISVQMAFEKDKLFTGQKVPLKVRVQNISEQQVEGIRILPISGMEISGEAEKTIASLSPGQSSEVSFSALAQGSGNYVVGCKAEYESRALECDTTSITIQSGLDIKLVASILLALISVAVFAYFYQKKE